MAPAIAGNESATSNPNQSGLGALLTWPAQAVQVLLAGAAGLAILGLFGRIMSFPIRHDEQMYLPVGVMFFRGDLYSDFGFNNMPNLPLLLGLVFEATGTGHYLLTARLVTFVGWLLALVSVFLLVRRAAHSAVAGLLAALLLVSNQTLLGQAGMLATNNFLPLAFAVAATALLIAGLDRPAIRPWFIAGAGLCVGLAAGFKLNYAYLIPLFAVTALAVPYKRGLSACLRQSILPLAIGGIIGSLPVLFYLLRDPDAFLAHVMRYHQGPHIAYWLANSHVDGEKVMTFTGKAKLAAATWLGGGMGLLVVAGFWCAWKSANTGIGNPSVPDAAAERQTLWPALLLLAIIGGGMVVSFIPTPAFPQYFVLPIPFIIILTGVLFGRLPAERRRLAAPWLGILAGCVIVWGVPRLIIKLPQVAAPQTWTGNVVHNVGVRLASKVGQEGAAGPVATLAPVYPLEGGMNIYTELVTGPLVYRVGDLIPLTDRRYYRLVSPTTIGGLLDIRPPSAILVGGEGALDTPLIAFALTRGYRLADPELVSDRYGKLQLWLRPPQPR